MAVLKNHFMVPPLFLALFMLWGCSFGSQYIVGDTIWTIPSNNYFYTNWSSSHSFHIGDTLVFDFDPELHNVMQVSRREYDSCTTNHPFQASKDAPATIHLREEGVYYFICSIVADHCALGQKLSVVVHRSSDRSVPLPSSPPPLAAHLRPLPPSPDWPQTPNANDWSTSVAGVANAYEGCNGEFLVWFMSTVLVICFLF